mmetsp:Transcript_4310/g.7911  ORF Transcript_4310/g.7911 Transcript_4310/m.7911 type:complete len:265 (+) Transcript_4310:657-1451(+)
MALVGQFGHLGDLATEGLRRELSEIIVLHPIHRKEIPQAGTHVLALDNCGIATVGAPGRLLAVGGGHSQNLAVLAQLGEHGATLASFHVEDHLLEHLLALHSLQGCRELLNRKHGAVGEGDDAWASVVHEVHEDRVARAALQNLARGSFGVAREHVHEQLARHDLAGVVDLAALVDIRGILSRLVEKLARERVLLALRHIVLHHEDDVLSLHAAFEHDLVGMAGIRLMTVVHEACGASSNHRILLCGSQGRQNRNKGCAQGHGF